MTILEALRSITVEGNTLLKVFDDDLTKNDEMLVASETLPYVIVHYPASGRGGLTGRGDPLIDTYVNITAELNPVNGKRQPKRILIELRAAIMHALKDVTHADALTPITAVSGRFLDYVTETPISSYPDNTLRRTFTLQYRYREKTEVLGT